MSSEKIAIWVETITLTMELEVQFFYEGYWFYEVCEGPVCIFKEEQIRIQCLYLLYVDDMLIATRSKK